MMGKTINIFFFDSTWSQLLRFGSAISAIIKSNNENVITFGVLCDVISSKEAQNHSFDFLLHSKNNLELADLITNNKPDIVVLFKNTVRDLNIILRAKKVGAYVVVLQHGMLYEGASLNNISFYELYAAFLNLRKTLLYLKILRQMCIFDNKSFYQLIKRIISNKKDVARIVQNYFDIKLNGDCALVIGEHWINYYHQHYDYDIKDIYLMGNHDVDNMEYPEELEDAICYIPSVHVEDGKVRQKVFMKFVKALSEAIDIKTKLYIKMHPRGNINLYKEAFAKHNVTYVTGPKLPYTKIYIGHNSTLIARALMITNKVILWRFKEEAELFYKPWCYAFCQNPKELSAALTRAMNDKEINKEKLKQIHSISYGNPEGAFNYAARTIIELFQKHKNDVLDTNH